MIPVDSHGNWQQMKHHDGRGYHDTLAKDEAGVVLDPTIIKNITLYTFLYQSNFSSRIRIQMNCNVASA